ncbi:MAG TPA: S8 family serine peptidase [Candidatus Elarobacter sp.]|jgi:subtilisin family serine protease
MQLKLRPITWVPALLAAAVLAACHGGSSTPKTKPTAAPTLDPRCTTLSPQSTGSTYTLTSNPSAISVRRVDPANTVATCVYFNGITPATDRPQTAPHPWSYVFAPTQASPYVVSIAQQLNGDHTLFYNQAGDSTGSINTGTLQSLRRSPASVGSSSALGVLQRGIRRFTGAGIVGNQVLVRYRGIVAQARSRAQTVAGELGARNGAEIITRSGSYESIVRVPAGTTAQTFARTLQSRSEVLDVFPVHKRFPLARAAQAVNDPHMQNNVDQWYLFADGFPNAWAYTHGANVKLAIIDTGADLNNTDLSQNIVFSTGYESAGHTAQDTNGHGTNVAGVADATANNSLGFAGGGFGGAGGVKLMIYNIFPDATASSDNQFGSVADEITAMNDAVSRGADVISMSLGSGQEVGSDNGFDQAERDAVENAIAAGVTVVAAAGNDADGGESGTAHTVLDYPAAYDGVISVGASALRDNNSGNFAGSTEYVAPYSQYGPGLSVVAPGGDPSGNDSNPLHWVWNYSTSTAAFGTGPGNGDMCRTPSPPTSCTAFFAGTSQATPQVAAAAALLIAAAGGHGTIAPARVRQIIQDTADNINDPHQGHGRLNIYRAVATLFSDTGAYSGPSPQKTSPTQVVAFAYSNSGGTVPTILDVNYPSGVPLDSSGNFRIGDVPVSAGTYRVGVWYDANGDGVINAGDQFGAPATSCNATSRCTIGTVNMTTVTAGFHLP